MGCRLVHLLGLYGLLVCTCCDMHLLDSNAAKKPKNTCFSGF